MKDLKNNIQKNNMKKLVLSVTLGMFCYCTNNAMEKPIKIDDVLMTMLEGQINIFNAKKGIQEHKPKIYSTIKDEDGKVKKGKLLEFIKNQFTAEEQKEAEFENRIRRIEQYFHLKEKNDNDECTEKTLTERFWIVDENENEKINKVEEIKQYFVAIHNAESSIDDAFKEYYKAKKGVEGGGEGVIDNMVMKEIIKECCGGEIEENLNTKFLENLKQLYDNANIEGDKEPIIRTIKKRITLKNKITEEDFISFLKQKIKIEEKKEEEKKDSPKVTNQQKKKKKKIPQKMANQQKKGVLVVMIVVEMNENQRFKTKN